VLKSSSDPAVSLRRRKGGTMTGVDTVLESE
jgi:hypothetical protein